MLCHNPRLQELAVIAPDPHTSTSTPATTPTIFSLLRNSIHLSSRRGQTMRNNIVIALHLIATPIAKSTKSFCCLGEGEKKKKMSDVFFRPFSSLLR